MIFIEKGAEPHQLSVFRIRAEERGFTPDRAYTMLRNPTKTQIRNILIAEQGGLCAYCMCRIPAENTDRGIAPISLEHIYPQRPPSATTDSSIRNQGLDYYNLVAVCHGNKAAKDERTHHDHTCDASKGNQVFQKLNPCEQSTLSAIYYDHTGRITSDDPSVEYDLNTILNLNPSGSTLINDRKAVLGRLVEEITYALDNGEELLEFCKNRLDLLKGATGLKEPFIGVVIWYLEDTVWRLGRHD